jgi:3-oxoacyl-[acyl-carrier-protein] synthase-1
MIPLYFGHATMVSSIGRGRQAHLSALQERQSGLLPCDFEGKTLPTYMGRVQGLEEVVLNSSLSHFTCRNNQLALLGLQQDGFEDHIAAARRQYGAHRIGVLIGTSTSGILETEHAYQQRNPESGRLPETFIPRGEYTQDAFSVAHFVRKYLALTGPAVVVSTACSSSAKVFATASRYIETGLCDAVLVGGVDSLCLTTLYGFSALQLTAPGPCRPCDANRDGLTIGEAAAFVFLEKSTRNGNQSGTALLGYGESSDAYHMSHPHPTGHGALLSMQKSLESSSLSTSDIDYIHMHGTATVANDQTEDLAIATMFTAETPCSSTKGWTGHTLGAAGAVAVVLGDLCLQHGLLPGCLNTNTIDPTFSSHILLENLEQPIRTMMSNFFGFGGNNCTLIFGRRS